MIHGFLRSIGFRGVKQNSELYKILEDVVGHPDEQQASEDEYGNEFVCFTRHYGNEFSISVCGNFLSDSEFRMEYYYPVFRGTCISTCEPVELEHHACRESFSGICDEIKLGVSLIFYIENVIDALRERKRHKDYVPVEHTVLAGLSSGGKILFPVLKTNHQQDQKKKSAEKRIHLMQQAREGNEVAIESLTLDDMDLYSMLSRRVEKEDILSIVESSFIPYGVENDQYVVIGEILNCYQTENPLTLEKVWILSIICNDLKFDVCVNARDLLGEPAIGRRFKGRIWMQGHLNFGY